MRSTLIVARMKPGSAPEVGRIFAESDAGELPHLIGVRERRLFHFHDLYVHYIASDDEVRHSLAEVRDHALFRDVNEKLGAHITAYDPRTWRGPEDAMAHEFYTWQAER
ncbi:TcmI family type II polyketide cyclase [Kitasatospora sp. NPDC056531]|uniref:TcmI family type II polyketide cyclase n=1 Tax=Kitasatospora sp. NPDC056531 TaxID=3345856 RepID=UPI0036AD9F37